MPPKGRGLTPIGTKNHTTPAQGTPVKVKAPVVTTRTSQKTPFSPATNVTTHGTNATTHHANFTPATNAPKTLKIARTKPETLGHAIQRMRTQGYGDNAIRGQIKTWHPGWSDQQIGSALGPESPGPAHVIVPNQLPLAKHPFFPGQRVRPTSTPGPTGDASTGWNAAQLALAASMRLQNQGVAGEVLQSSLEGLVPVTVRNLAAGKHTSLTQIGEDVGNTALNFAPAGKAAGILGGGLKALRLARSAEDVARAGKLAEDSGSVAQEALSASQVAAQHTADLRAAMRGAKGARIQQDALQSEARRAKLAAAEEAMTAPGVHPLTRDLNASAALKGQLPTVNYGGFSQLTGDALVHGIKTIQEHPTLLAGEKKNGVRGLRRAFDEGRPPAPHEQRVIDIALGKDAIKVPIPKQGTAGNILSNVVNTPRTLEATLDLSGFLRQGLVALGRHPIITSKNFIPMVKAFASEDFTKSVEHEIASRPTFPMMQAGKVALTGGDALSPHEEQFAAHLLEGIGGSKNPIHWSSRAYSTFLNKTRADVFDQHLKLAQAKGYDIHNEDFLKQLGEAVNVFTGRGRLPGDYERAASVLNGLYFSPRLALSRGKTVLKPFDYRKGTHPYVRRQYQRAAGQTFGALASILALAKYGAGINVGVDPRSSDFGKMKFGKTRVDLGAGFLQYGHLAGELITREKVNSSTGKLTHLGSGYGQTSPWDVITNFAGQKASPTVGFIRDVAKEKTNFGPFNLKQEAANRLTPLVAQDTWDIAHNNSGGLKGVGETVAGATAGVLGAGLQTYGAQKTSLDKTAAKDIAAVNALAEKGHKATALKNVQTYYAVRKAINFLGLLPKGQKSERKRVLATLEALHSSGFMPTSDYNKYSKYYKSGKGAKLDESTLRKDRRWFTQTLTTEIQNLHKAMKASPAKPGS